MSSRFQLACCFHRYARVAHSAFVYAAAACLHQAYLYAGASCSQAPQLFSECLTHPSQATPLPVNILQCRLREGARSVLCLPRHSSSQPFLPLHEVSVCDKSSSCSSCSIVHTSASLCLSGLKSCLGPCHVQHMASLLPLCVTC